MTTPSTKSTGRIVIDVDAPVRRSIRIEVLGEERDRHISDSRTDCGARAPFSARLDPERNPRERPFDELHCTREPGHDGTPHEDALHTYTFWKFEEEDVTDHRPRDLAACVVCNKPWPCPESLRLDQRIIAERTA